MNDFLALLIAAALGFGAAWSWQESRAGDRINAIAAQHEKESGDAARQSARNLITAQNNTDRIDDAAALRTANLERQLQETQHALKTATYSRPCLGGAALRLLDRAPGLKPGPADPAFASPLYRGSAGPAADPEDQSDDYATDTQVAGWIAGAKVLYEQCRGRIRDIREWSNGTAAWTGAAVTGAAYD